MLVGILTSAFFWLVCSLASFPHTSVKLFACSNRWTLHSSPIKGSRTASEEAHAQLKLQRTEGGKNGITQHETWTAYQSPLLGKSPRRIFNDHKLSGSLFYISPTGSKVFLNTLHHKALSSLLIREEKRHRVSSFQFRDNFVFIFKLTNTAWFNI